MTLKLSLEQREALDRSDGPVAVEDERTHRRYFLVDETTFQSLQQQEDLAAIRAGIADMEAGRVSPLDEVVARIRTDLGLPKAG
jgi:predicted transcriptional regulator